MTRSIRRAAPAAVGNALLTAAAAAGAVCIALVVLSFLFNVSLIMFKTGSMSPTIPAGSVALVREVPAAEVAVGDIVTVDRPGELPVTHRITSTAPGTTPDERVLTMKGDANELEDFEPYVVDTARVTLAHVPGVAHVVAWFGTPAVLGGVAVAASALVTWAFWPRDEPRPPKGRGRPSGQRGAGAGVLAIAAATVVVLAVPGDPAAAAGAEETITGTHLTLLSIADDVEAMSAMAPGDLAPWQVGIWADAAEPGIVRAGLSGSGGGPAGLMVRVRECAERWISGSCGDGERTLRALSRFPLDGSDHPLTRMPSSSDSWLLIEVGFPDDGSAAPVAPATLRLTAVGLGDSIDVGRVPGVPPANPGVPPASTGVPPAGPRDPLASTGAALLPPLAVAVGAVGLGLVLAALARRRRS